jgi:hypothetical protein
MTGCEGCRNERKAIKRKRKRERKEEKTDAMELLSLGLINNAVITDPPRLTQFQVTNFSLTQWLKTKNKATLLKPYRNFAYRIKSTMGRTWRKNTAGR